MVPPGEMCTSPSAGRTRSLSWPRAAASAAPFTSTAAPWSCCESSSSAHGHSALLGTSFSGNAHHTWYLDRKQRSFLGKRLVLALSSWLGLSALQQPLPVHARGSASLAPEPFTV